MRYMSIVLAGAMLFLAGCGGSAPSSKPEPSKDQPASSAPAAAPAAPKETMKVKLAFAGSKTGMLWLPSAFAYYNNYFKDEAIEIEIVEMKGGAEAAQALVSGDVDFASMALEHAIKAKAQGVDLTMLSLYTRYPGFALVVDSKLKDKVKSVKDLKGMKVGITSPGSSTHKALLSVMSAAGMQPSDIEAIPVGTSVIPAIEAGKVQATMHADPWITQLITSGKAYSIADLRAKQDTESLFGGDYPNGGLVTRSELLTKNSEMVSRMVRAIVKANKFLAGNSAETIASKLPAEFKGTDEALFLASLRANLEMFAPDSKATEKGLQAVIDSLKKDKVIPETADIKPASVFDSSFIGK